MGLKQINLPKYTIADLEQWNDIWELIEGIPFAMSPAPSTGHQRVEKRIGTALENGINLCSHCEVFHTINLKFDENTVLIPDLSIFCEEVGDVVYVEKTPVLIAEVLSPSTMQKDVLDKFELYQSKGIKYYLIVNPKTENIKIYSLKNDRYELVFDAENGEYTFTFNDCTPTVNFSKIW